MEEFKEKFILGPEPICDICEKPHKTSLHDYYEEKSPNPDKKYLEKIDIRCEICGDSHKTSQHLYKKENFNIIDKKFNKEIRCEICGGLHKTSQHKK